MQRRSFLLLAGATVASLLLAIISLASGRTVVIRTEPGQKALPGLAAKLGELAWVRLTRGAIKIDFAQIGRSWLVVEKGNYPAAEGRVPQMLLALSDLTLVEPKTERTELLPRLDLDDPANGKATAVTVQDKAGEVVADLIVGKRRFDRLGAGNDGVYVRRPGEDRAWLARGSLDLSGDLTNWLDRQILDIGEARIASVTLKGAQGAPLVISRTAAGADFTIAGAPANTKPKSAAVLAEPARALQSLELDDVRPAPDMPVPQSGVVAATYATFDGLTVNLRLFEHDNANWVAIDTTGTGASETESRQINDKVQRWVFAIPLFKAGVLRTKLPDLVEPPPKGS